MGYFHQTSTLRAQGRGSGMQDTKETMISMHNRTAAQMNLWRLWEHAQGLHRSKHGRDLPSLTKKPSPVDNRFPRENSLSLMDSHSVDIPHSMTDPMPSNRLRTQYTINDMVSWEIFFFCFLSHNALSRLLFYFLPYSFFLLIYHGFKFCVFMHLLCVNYLHFSCLFSKERERGKKVWNWVGEEDLVEGDGEEIMTLKNLFSIKKSKIEQSKMK